MDLSRAHQAASLVLARSAGLKFITTCRQWPFSASAASRAVWLGADGALCGLAASNALAIECSTLSHDWVLELAGLATRSALRYLDAPVTGLPDTAAAGELTLLVGADAEHLQAARPLLKAFSRQIVHFGPPGAGTAYKLLVNLLGAVQIASAAETMALAERTGLDPQLVARTIATGQAASPQVVRNTQRMADDDHERAVNFTPRLRLKDVEYALAFARKLGLEAPFGTLALQSFRELALLGRAELNESAVIEVARRREIRTRRSRGMHGCRFLRRSKPVSRSRGRKAEERRFAATVVVTRGSMPICSRADVRF